MVQVVRIVPYIIILQFVMYDIIKISSVCSFNQMM